MDPTRPPPTDRWLTTEEAARFLGMSVITLRRALDRNARRVKEGGVEATVDGLRGRKLGRQWRVLLGPGWSPRGGEHS